VLTELRIENVGVIREVQLLIGPGLWAVTGETGAGKTMVVEALDLLLGGRADGVVVRAGATEARVEGRFELDDTEVVLARVVPAEGRSRAYIDGRLATAASLAEWGARFVDLHGQHAHQSLFATAAQRAALDQFGKVDLAPLREARGRVAEIEAAAAALGGDARARAREIDLLRFQVQELDAAGLEDPDEDVQLRRLEDLLADATAHREAALLAVEALTADGGAIDAAGAAVTALEDRAPFAGAAERLASALAELADIASDVRHAGESIDDDPERLAAVRERRQVIRDLRRKYGDTVAEVMAFHQEAADRLAELEGHDERLAELERERAAAIKALRRAERAVGAARRAAAGPLAAKVTEQVRRLAMPRAELEVHIDADDPAGEAVTFLFAANPGLGAAPLAKVASGGELARVMLALRLVLSAAPDTLVFDEVDAGIGGAAAVAVAESLAELGRRHQVLVVTHLAQVAAAADHHVTVTKVLRRNSTETEVKVIDGEERVEEIARMLSGDPELPSAKTHAAELLTRR
jgi:DNA repair protein RecN (Recombination protein N)